MFHGKAAKVKDTGQMSLPLEERQNKKELRRMGKREKLHVQWQGPIQQISNINPSKQIERECKEKY